MQELLSTDTATLAADTPLGIGSLAEAIVRRDVNAAYRMIEHRPMVALSDAAADLDAVYRERLTGERADTISDLRESVAGLSTEALETVIRALTSAVDGTYHDEHEAVKMAIMKAVSSVDGK
ncbi:MAG: hypothetical protein R3B69_02085 [Candidatus Paceibacterota bacterium]